MGTHPGCGLGLSTHSTHKVSLPRSSCISPEGPTAAFEGGSISTGTTELQAQHRDSWQGHPGDPGGATKPRAGLHWGPPRWLAAGGGGHRASRSLGYRVGSPVCAPRAQQSGLEPSQRAEKGKQM